MSRKPDFEIEYSISRDADRPVCGVDEAGRGPLAGPVVAAAVILDPDRVPDRIDDSKKLTERMRRGAFKDIMKSARAVSVVSLSARTIDRMNIRAATLLAMQKAVLGLSVPPWAALIDGNVIPDDLPCRAMHVVKGDQKSLSVAAASIIAKVTRDEMMAVADREEPEFGFSQHKGYGSADHRERIHLHGPGRFHRRSFAPIKHMNSG